MTKSDIKSDGRTPGRPTLYTGIGLVLGILVGAILHGMAAGPAEAKEIAGYFTLCTDIFPRLIKMIVAPLVFATIVSGIASFGDTRSVGRVAALAMGWFLTASVVSLTLGFLVANLFQPGAGLAMPLPAVGILLIMGVDQILDMGRTVTNVLGNGLATAAVAQWQGEMGDESGAETDLPAEAVADAMPALASARA